MGEFLHELEKKHQELKGDRVSLNFGDIHLAWLVCLAIKPCSSALSSTRVDRVSAVSFVPSCSVSSFASSHFSDLAHPAKERGEPK